MECQIEIRGRILNGGGIHECGNVRLNKSQMEQLELYQKKLVKQILSVPTNTSDAAVYILSDLLAVEAQIHKRETNILQ